MIKNCRVILNNKYSTVVDFDGTLVQLPTINRDASFVRVLYKDGKYKAVKDDYIEVKSNIMADIAIGDESKPTKRTYKKTTTKRATKKEVVEE